STSLKRPAELFIFPPLWVPERPQFDNYAEVFRQVPFGLWYFNSVVVVALSTLGVLLTATLVAYSFARFRWPGRDLLFAVTLGTMMLPAEVTLIPKYILFKNLGWLNTILPLWVPAWFGGGAFIIFLLRQFIMSLPRDFDEAATIDGANPWQVLHYILLPLMKPALATIAVLHAIWAWNEFLEPLIYLASPEKFTLALGLRYFNVTPGQQSFGIPTEHLLMASVVMSTLPIILLFFLAQKYFVQGIVMSGLKG
ncbi:MAG TPA: carbohydrate ABC transporter permease, partial [Caldilineaceae bacterium]|nr:carbohydrate ABC transporter permease [Caldilineaceae bacterium]